MISRAQAAKLVRKQLNHNIPTECMSKYGSTTGMVIPKPQWHYGKVEIKQLLDAIYGPPNPADIEEHII